MDDSGHETLLEQLHAFPAELREFVSRFPPAAYRERMASGGFSLIEHLCHLRDLEREGFLLRIRRILAEPMPELQEIDGSTLALERDYQSQDAWAAWQDWRQARTETVALLRTALPAQAGRTGIYGGFGVVTLGALAQGIATHDRAHLHELRALAAGLARPA